LDERFSYTAEICGLKPPTVSDLGSDADGEDRDSVTVVIEGVGVKF